MKFITSFFIFGFFCYCSITALLYIFQRNLLYFPTPKFDHPFEEIQFQNQGETISVISLNKNNDKALIYFGGNGEAVVASADELKSAFPDFTIYLLNYRAFGGSTGKPTEKEIYADALALYKIIKQKHTNISVIGRSLGSGVATYLAANRNIHKTVLVTPYDSILNIAKKQFRFFPVKLLLKDKFDSLSRVNSISSKVLVIAAEHDEVIPMENTENLVNKFPNEQIRFKLIYGSGHNNLSISKEYYSAIFNFLGKG